MSPAAAGVRHGVHPCLGAAGFARATSGECPHPDAGAVELAEGARWHLAATHRAPICQAHVRRLVPETIAQDGTLVWCAPACAVMARHLEQSLSSRYRNRSDRGLGSCWLLGGPAVGIRCLWRAVLRLRF